MLRRIIAATVSSTLIPLGWSVPAATAGTPTEILRTTPVTTSATGNGADFDGDGAGDIVSAYTRSYRDITNYGVLVRYSSSTSGNNGSTYWWAVRYSTPEVALAAGDLNNDGYDDLVIGIPFEDYVAQSRGQIHILYGSASGLRTELYLDQDSPGVPGSAEVGDQFGRALAVGDINNDGYDDLAVGSPGESINSHPRAGMIHIFLGSAGGISGASLALSQADESVPGADEAYDEFGRSLAIGDVTGDGYADVAIGSPGENGVGMVSLLNGSADGINPTGATSQVAATTTDVTPRRLGQTMLIADTTGDGLGEVIAGAPDSTVNGYSTAGAVSVYLGRATGLSNTGRGYWHQDSPGVPGGAETGDRFGTALAAGPLLGSARIDLVVGVQYEAVGSLPKAGAIVVLPGAATTTGLTGTDSRFIDQNTTDVPGSAEENDQMGSSLQIITDNGDTVLLVGALEEQLLPEDGPGSGMLTRFVNDNGTLSPRTPTIIGPQLGGSDNTVYRLGMSTVSG